MPRQPTAQHVDHLAATRRNSIEVLKKIGECCLKEASSWASNVSAILKAKTDEEKAAARESKKEEKRAAAAAKRAKEKAAKEAKRIADAAARSEQSALADAAGPEAVEGDDDGSKKKTRNRNRSGQSELVESDPALFHTMFKFSVGAMAVSTEVMDFATSIAQVPDAASLARLRRGHFKKVMSVALMNEFSTYAIFVFAFKGTPEGDWVILSNQFNITINLPSTI